MPDRDTALLPLGEDWSMWPLLGLRAAGLPAGRVLSLRGYDREATEAFAADGWFREALAWQNRDMVRNWLAGYAARLAAGDHTLHRRSYREGLIARYAQRYTTKNDTIGFFGPIGWAVLDSDGPFRVRSVPSGAEVTRGAFFETRALTELAARWSADRQLRRWLPPWRDPSGRFRDEGFERPRRGATRLSTGETAVLRQCDGRRTPADILAALAVDEPGMEFADVTEVLSVLSALERKGCLSWGLRLPVDDRAEHHLAAQLRAVPDAEVRNRYLGHLAELTTARDEVDAAAGDPERVLAALTAVGERFEALSGAAADRTNAERPTGRGVLWSDALADWDVRVGSIAAAELGPPLALLADVCRWLTWQVATGITDVVRRRLRREHEVPFAVLVAELAPELTGADGSVLDKVRTELVAKVTSLLPLPAEPGPRRFEVGVVRNRWVEAFDAPAPGWEGARMHSPDVMLASRDGDELWVLNEIHVAVNTLDNRFFVRHQRKPGEIEELVRQSTRAVRYVPAVARSWPDVTSRTYPPLTVDVPGKFTYWSMEADDVLPIDVPRIATAGLVVTSVDGDPMVTGGELAPVPFAEFAGELLSFLVGNAFQLFPRLPYLPRVQVGSLVVQRETWHLPVGEILAAAPRVGGEGQLVAHLRAQRVPRHCYVQLPGDSKPFFCDLESELLVRNLLRLLHRVTDTGARFRVQEMLPDFEQLWLTDAAGGRRTSEFRMVVVDDRMREDM